jgi:hypothetical protein
VLLDSYRQSLFSWFRARKGGELMTFNIKRACGFVTASCFVSLSVAADRFDPKDYQTQANFELVVDKSKYLKPGSSKVAAQSAFVSLVHGLIPGNSDGLEVMFFSKPVGEASLPDIMNNDAKEMRRSSYVALVLFLDRENKVWQVNLSYVVPGTTVARTVAWKPEELRRYFSNMSFKDGRLVLKSAGSYSETEPAQDVLKIRWDVDLDLPVKREVKR